nr:hypothetical protein [Nonomuraea montanisoli]
MEGPDVREDSLEHVDGAAVIPLGHGRDRQPRPLRFPEVRQRELDVLPGVRRLILAADHVLGDPTLDEKALEGAPFNDPVVAVHPAGDDDQRS